MDYSEEIYTKAQLLPEELQLRLLDFIEFLVWKTRQEKDEAEILADAYMVAIEESEEDIAQGKVISHQDLKNEAQSWRGL